MNRADIIRMANEAKAMDVHSPHAASEGSIQRLERFAALVATAAREECAKLCDAKSAEQDEHMSKAGSDREQFAAAYAAQDMADELAAAFRAMGNEGGGG